MKFFMSHNILTEYRPRGKHSNRKENLIYKNRSLCNNNNKKYIVHFIG